LVVATAAPKIRCAGAAPLPIVLALGEAGAASVAWALLATATAPHADAGAGIGADLLSRGPDRRQPGASRRQESPGRPPQNRSARRLSG